jgi:hypothetical protein
VADVEVAEGERAAALDPAAELGVGHQPVVKLVVEVAFLDVHATAVLLSQVIDSPARQMDVRSRQNAWNWSGS